MNKSVVVNSTVALWFRIARVFGMAPVSIRSDRDGCRVSVCTYSAFYGYFIGVVFNAAYIGYVYNVIKLGKITELDRTWLFWGLDAGVVLIIVDPVIACGAKLQSIMINDLIQLDKFVTLLLFAFKICLIIFYEEIRNSLQIINQELQRLYEMVGKDIEPKSQVFAWSLSRRLRVLCHSYWSTIAIYRRANKANELKYTFMFILYAYRLALGIYMSIVNSFRDDKELTDKLVMITILVIIGIVHLIEMIQFTEPFQHIYNEVETTCETLQQFKNRSYNLGKKVVKHLDIFMDLALEKAYCTPLGIFTMKNSLVATTISAIATGLAIIFQFNSSTNKQ
ncbi:unnamed protein product [Colias eurytheme]|nr:unnamed protein product [Colias eurytheme]